ncbi:MAG: hypothetical protein ABJD11_05940 [Gemmatimonadota bacterium]
MKRIVLLFLVLGACIAGPAYAQAYQVIVNVGNDVTSLSKDEASKLFLKQTGKWSDGKAVTPVDQDRDSKVREAFSHVVHGRSSSAITAYWQQQIFSGQDVPPIEKAGDADVVSFVQANAGAVGYVSGGATLGSGVKVVAIR